jgi:hypothetical protein
MRSLTGAIEPPFARHFGGHPLEELARGAIVDQHVELGLPEQVDEARRDDLLARVDAARRRPFHIADRDDAIVTDGHAASIPRRTSTIDDSAVDNQ